MIALWKQRLELPAKAFRCGWMTTQCCEWVLANLLVSPSDFYLHSLSYFVFEVKKNWNKMVPRVPAPSAAQPLFKPVC